MHRDAQTTSAVKGCRFSHQMNHYWRSLVDMVCWDGGKVQIDARHNEKAAEIEINCQKGLLEAIERRVAGDVLDLDDVGGSKLFGREGASERDRES